MSRLAETFILVVVAAAVVVGIMVYARVSTKSEFVPHRPTDYIGVVEESPETDPPKTDAKTQVALDAPAPPVVDKASEAATKQVEALPGVPQIDPGISTHIEMAVPAAIMLDKKAGKEAEKDSNKKEKHAAKDEKVEAQGVQLGSREELQLLRRAQESLNRLYQLKLRGYSTPAIAEKEARKLSKLLDQLPDSTSKRVRAIIEAGYGQTVRKPSIIGKLDGKKVVASEPASAELGKVESTPRDVKGLNTQIEALRTKLGVKTPSSSEPTKTYDTPSVEGSLDKEVKAQDL
jgi:hypothetical protein